MLTKRKSCGGWCAHSTVTGEPLTRGVVVFSALHNALRLLLRPEWTRGRSPSAIQPGKVAAQGTEPVVVFLVGIRINKWRKVGHWLPLLVTMPGMLQELVTAPDGGLLGYRLLIGPGPRQAMLLQYWRGSDDLLRFARESSGMHRSAQRRFWRHYGSSDAVGVWHELLPVAAGAYHGVYGNMPPMGLGALNPIQPELWWLETAGSRRGPDDHSVSSDRPDSEPRSHPLNARSECRCTWRRSLSRKMADGDPIEEARKLRRLGA
jgi:Domain of unknown function (DUF4188)